MKVTTKQEIEEAFGLNDGSNGKKIIEIKELSVEQIFKGISKLETLGYADAKNKDITLFIGATKCGKSTTANLFLDNNLVVRRANEPNKSESRQKIVMVKKNDLKGSFPVIGTKTTSETTFPVKYESDRNDELWDCPGFGDTRGPQQEIINAWFLSKLFKTAAGVKLINLCSSDSISGDNASEFRGYIEQIINLFGREQLAKKTQALIFTKAQKEDSAEDLHEDCLNLIKEHFTKEKAVYEFFKNAKVMKIDKVEQEDIGKELNREHISDVMYIHDNEMKYEKIESNVAVDANTTAYLLGSVSKKLCNVAFLEMMNAYKQAYNSELKNELEKIFKDNCTDDDFVNLVHKFNESKKLALEKICNDKVLQKHKTDLDKIVDFVLKITPDNDLKQLVSTNILAVDLYNNEAMDYTLTTDFLHFLINNSSKITAKSKFHKEWEEILKILEEEKPNKDDLFKYLSNFSDLHSKKAKAYKDMLLVTEKIDYAVQKEVDKKYSQDTAAILKELKEKQEKYGKDIDKVTLIENITDASVTGFSAMSANALNNKNYNITTACAIAVGVSVAVKAGCKYYKDNLKQPEHEEAEKGEVIHTLDKSYVSHIDERSPINLVGDFLDSNDIAI